MTRRTTPLPKGWAKLRLAVLDRDGHRCTWTDNGDRCPSRATEVDHVGPPNVHDPRLLRSLCTPHHRRRTAHQANAAKTPRRRPPEQHPGVVADR
jgi:hypothetical protein